MAASATSLVLDRKEICKGLSLWSWNLSLDSAHWASSALLSLCRGMNDAPKIWALCFPLLALGGMQGANYFLLVALVAGAMGAGSLLAGRKVSVVLAERVTRMNPAQSLGANLTAALLVGAATAFALPVFDHSRQFRRHHRSGPGRPEEKSPLAGGGGDGFPPGS